MNVWRSQMQWYRSKLCFVIGLALFFFLSNFSFIVFAQTEQDYLLLGNEFVKTKRPQVKFYHDKHNQLARIEDNCVLCHHIYRDGKIIEDESSEDQKCVDCHKIKDKVLNLQDAYHKLCKGCHLKQHKGPILCGECHKKYNK